MFPRGFGRRRCRSRPTRPSAEPKYIRVKVVEWATGPNPTAEVELFRLENLDAAGYFQPPDEDEA
jgi:hypothetical protein